jgi:formylglycine-generating enzyme required for sulfatase activity
MKFLLLAMVWVSLAMGQSAPDETQTMASIPAGEFWMGRTHTNNVATVITLDRDSRDDVPAHKAYVDGFLMDKHEITNEEYARFAEATGAAKPWYWIGGKVIKGEEKHPVHYVNFAEAEAYCRWAGKRLPTEAEWERAARGGLDRKRYPWGDEAARGRAQAGSGNGTAAVGSFAANAYGLFDMAGNVWEWTSDWYDRDYYTVSPKNNPRGVETGRYKVIRGGGWTDGAQLNSARNYADPESRFPVVGFAFRIRTAPAPGACGFQSWN